MVCNRCGTFIPQDVGYCPKCGAPATQQNRADAGNHFCKNCGSCMPAGINVCPRCGTVENNAPQQVNIYHQPPMAETAPVTTIGQYIGRMLVGAIPLIGWIIAIIFAIDSSNKNRANFFRAQIVMFLIVVLLAVAAILIFGSSALFFLESFI